jgi:hypothetical protein
MLIAEVNEVLVSGPSARPYDAVMQARTRLGGDLDEMMQRFHASYGG